jgi:hypothetical protein
MLKTNRALSVPRIYIKYRKAKNFKSSLKAPKHQNAIKKIKFLDQMEPINPLNHYYNLFCLGRLSENVATPLWPSVGVKPNTSKVGDLESSRTPECLEFNSKAQNYSH